MNTYDLESAKGGEAVTPGTPFPKARGLWVGTEGDVNVVFPGGQTAIYYSVKGLLPVDCVEVLVSGTTATNITTLA